MKVFALNKQAVMKDNQLISLDDSKVIKGLLAVLIIFHHSSLVLSFSIGEQVVRFFDSIGYILTGLFFILSGYGVMKQIELKGAEYLKSFWKSRVKKIIIPYAILSILCYVLRIIVGGYDFTVFIEKICVGDFPVPYSWYIIALLIEEFVFYLCFRVLHFRLNMKKQWIIVIMFILTIGLSVCFFEIGFGMWYYSSLLCFPLGILMEYKETAIIRKLWFIIPLDLIAGIILFVLSEDILNIIYRNMFVLVLGMLVISFFYLLNIKIKCFIWLSNYSLEVYLIHGIILFGMSSIMSNAKGEILVWLVVIASIVCAVIWKKLYYAIYERITYGKNRNVEG